MNKQLLIALLLVSVVLFVKRKKIKQVATEIKDVTLSAANKKFIDELNPSVKEKFARFIYEIKNTLGNDVIITSGYRSFKKQAELDKQNNKNAAAGFSLHNYGHAIDINVRHKGKWLRKKDTDEAWNKTGVPQLAKKFGFRWGGDFKTYQDPVHFDSGADAEKLFYLAKAQFAGKEIIGNLVAS